MAGVAAVLTVIGLLSGCQESEESEMVRHPGSEGSDHAEAGEIRVTFLGTSLTEGYGLDHPRDAFPGRIQAMADSAGYPVQVTEVGVSGETSAGARERIEWVMSRPTDILVLEVGANDGLRSLDPSELERNLDTIVRRAREAEPEVRILLLGMKAPPNAGPEYARRFESAFETVGGREDVALGPFLLEGVAGEPELNQADGIHPTREGHAVMARTVWKALEPILEEVNEDERPELADSLNAGANGG